MSEGRRELMWHYEDGEVEPAEEVGARITQLEAAVEAKEERIVQLEAVVRHREQTSWPENSTTLAD